MSKILLLEPTVFLNIQEVSGQKPRVLSIDDYYMTEVTEEKKDERGVKRKMAVMKYQHDAEMEEVKYSHVRDIWKLGITPKKTHP